MELHLKLFSAASKKTSALVQWPDGTVRHLHSTVKPENEAAYFPAVKIWAETIVLCGVGLGYHLHEVKKSIPSQATIVIIDFFQQCASFTQNSLFTATDNAIFIIHGRTNASELDDTLQLLNHNQKSIQIIKHPASYAMNCRFYDSILERILRPFRHQTGQHRFQAPQVLLLQGKFFLEQEVCRAIRETTRIEPALFHYEDRSSDCEYESLLQAQLQKNRPDCIFSINMKGFDGSGILAGLARLYSIPVIVWFVDDPHPILLHQKQFINPMFIAATWEKEYVNYLKSTGFSSVLYLPLAADPHLFRQNAPMAGKQSPVPLGFVGSSMGREFLNEIKKKFLWQEMLQPIVDDAARQLLQTPHQSVLDLLSASSSKRGVTLPFRDERNLTWLGSYTIHQASMNKRHGLIEALISDGIEVFGDPQGWREMLGDALVARPSFDYASGIASVYRSIAITVNSTSCQMPTAVNQRVFDVPMAGGFIISDRQESLLELFEPQHEAVCYGSMEELRSLIAFYRRFPEKKQQISASARKRILGEHTYTHRCHHIFAAL
ncbi:MAG: glycosyltransferase [Chitinivibrionales bacterium]|nr:glycosyltransferase [Chitinivibrionales bacterium]